MELPLCRHHRQQSILKLGRRPNTVDPLKVQLGVCHICVRPAWFYLCPGKVADHINAALELVKHDGLEVRVIADDIGNIVEGVFDLSRLVQFQKGLPAFLIKLLIELCLGKPHTLSGKLHLHTLILDGKFLHRLKGRQFCRVGIRICTGIQRAELVNTNHIKCIHQLAAGRVCGMVAIGELIFIENHTRLGVRRNIVVTPRHGTVLVHIGEKSVDGIGYRISTAESTHGSGLLQRVCLLFDVTLDDTLLPLGNRPLCGVTPVRVFCQNGIRVQQVTLHLVKYELSIGGGAGPVHQTARLVGGIIEEFDTDLLCDLSGNRAVFIRGHFTGQRDDQAEPGLLRRVFMGAVEIALEGEEHLDLVNDVRGGIVHIQ